MNTYTKAVRHSLHFFINQRWKMLLLVGMEALFIFLFGIIAIPLRDAIQINLVNLGDAVVSASSDAGFNLGKVIFASPETAKIASLLLVLFLSVYLLYCLIHGWIWRYCLKTRHYLKAFFKVNVFWGVVFCLYLFINFILSYADTVGVRVDPEGNYFLGDLSQLFLLVLGYFAFISYIVLSTQKKKVIRTSLSLGVGKILPLGGGFIMMFLSVVGVHYILLLFGKLHDFFVIIGGFVLLLPLFIILRVFFAEVLKHELLEKHSR